MDHDYVLVAGRANPELAKKIADFLHKPLLSVDILQFKDGEIQVYYNETIRGRDVFIIQPTFSPADNIIELLIAIDAAKRSRFSASTDAGKTQAGWILYRFIAQ